MAEGKVHELYILYATGATLIGSVLISDKVPLDLLVCANLGMLSNVYVSPDLDLDGTILCDLRIAQTLTIWLPNSKFKEFVIGRIIRFVKICFSIYSLNLVHRSFLSHLPILGTLIRWGYIYFIVWWLFLQSYYTFAELNHIVLNLYLNYTLTFLTFAAVGDTIHATLDSWELNWNLW